MSYREATVEFAMLDQAIAVRLLDSSEVRTEEMLIYKSLQIDASALPPLDSLANVTSHGTKLREALSSHGAIRDELNQICNLASPKQARLRFLFGIPVAAMYRWEALCAQNGFLALNESCSVGRVPMSGAAKNNSLAIFSGPVRLVAFLSPALIPSAGEFAAIATNIEAARAAGLDIKAILYVGEEELLGRALPNVEVRPIPDTAAGLEAAIRADQPQLLHFFCHGRFSGLGEQLLELASISDHDTEAQTGSITLSIQRLREALVAVGTSWLTVLNSCNGAKQVPRLHSMAATLVAEGGAPIAVGMAEEIAPDDATLFAGVFYREALEALRRAISPLQPGEPVVIDLGPAVGRARKELFSRYEMDAEKFGRWCLPVLYHRLEPLRVARLPDPTMRDRIETVAQALRTLAVTTPPELRMQIRGLLANDPAVPETLWPDQFGNLP